MTTATIEPHLTPLSRRLRAATADLHREAESVLDLTAAIHDRASYAATLDRFHGFYVPLNQALRRFTEWPSLDIDRAARDQAARAAADLAALGLQPSPATAPAFAALTTFPQALGALYVQEGSTLGGQIILRQIAAAQMGIPPGAMSFFAGHGPANGAMWRSFVGALDAFGAARPADQPAVEDGARLAFRAIIDWFRP